MSSRFLGRENSASITLHAVRAAAAQIVCVGHAVNISGVGYTYLPQFGVMVFFLLSGFVIADTLFEKSQDEQFDLPTYAIQRFARIYTAYLPALLIIAAADHVSRAIGLYGGDLSLKTWVANLLMLQQYPMKDGFGNFGSTGHLTSVAIEFHIYLLVGAAWFLARWRNPFLCLLVAMIFCRMPLHYFHGIPHSDKALFVLWLIGFASYFFVRAIATNKKGAAASGVIFVFLISGWLRNRIPGDEYDLANYPAVAVAFVALLVFAKSIPFQRVARAEPAIKYFADYSFSLFLVHMTIVKVVIALSPFAPWPSFIASVVCANLLAMIFAYVFERHYHVVSRWMVRYYGAANARIDLWKDGALNRTRRSREKLPSSGETR